MYISGTVNITLKNLINNLSQVTLDANELTTDGVKENHLSQTFQSDSGHLLVRLSNPAARGEVRTLTVRYHGKPTRGVRFFPDHMYAFYDTSHCKPSDIMCTGECEWLKRRRKY